MANEEETQKGPQAEGKEIEPKEPKELCEDDYLTINRMSVRVKRRKDEGGR